MERTKILELMSRLKLYGMRAAYDEVMTTDIKRRHEPPRIVGDLLSAEIAEKQARSIKYQLTIAKLPLVKDIDDFDFAGTPVNQAQIRPDVSSGTFLAEQRNAVLIGGTGTGKSHLAIAIARACIRGGSIPPAPWRFKLAAVIPAVPPPTIKTLWCIIPAIMALPSNWRARCGLGHSLAKHRIIIFNPMSIAVQHAHEGRRFFAPAPPPRQNVACEGVGLIRLRFRGMLCRGLASWSDFVSGGTESSRKRVSRSGILVCGGSGNPSRSLTECCGTTARCSTGRSRTMTCRNAG